MFKPADRVGERVKRAGGREWAVYKEGFQVNKLLHGRTHTHTTLKKKKCRREDFSQVRRKAKAKKKTNEGSRGLDSHLKWKLDGREQI